MRQWFWLLIPVILAFALPACTPAAGPNDRVLFMLGEQYDPQEFWGPYSALVAAGYKVDLVGAKKGMELTPDSVIPEANVKTNISLDEVNVSNYFALFTPGGPSAANVAANPLAGRIAKKFNDEGKFIGTVCHGARILMPEGIFKNRPTTCIFMVADELCDQWKAGDYGMYLDLPVVIDKNLICSRDPRDIPTMAAVLVDRFAESGGLKVVPRGRPVHAMIILPGATKHQKWVLDRLSIFGILPMVLSEEQIADLKADDKTLNESDMLVVFDGPGMEKLNSTPLATIVNSFSNAKKTILVTEVAKKTLPSIDLTTAKVIQPANLAYAMRQIVESVKQDQSYPKTLPRTEIPDSKVCALFYTVAARKPITGVPFNTAVEYDAVLALWYGYDDDAAARMNEFLVSQGRKVLIVGPMQKGVDGIPVRDDASGEEPKIKGLNGSIARYSATYDDPIKLSASAIIVAPGGLWPKKTKAQQAVQPKWVEDDEPARQKRYDWLIGQYKAGKMLVAFGFDSLYIGQRPLFKGKKFASTDQTSVIWFGDTGAEYSPEKAMFSDKNLITVKPLVGVDDAIKLLQEYLKSK